jgi:hypothetical protein
MNEQRTNRPSEDQLFQQITCAIVYVDLFVLAYKRRAKEERDKKAELARRQMKVEGEKITTSRQISGCWIPSKYNRSRAINIWPNDK